MIPLLRLIPRIIPAIGGIVVGGAIIVLFRNPTASAWVALVIGLVVVALGMSLRAYLYRTGRVDRHGSFID